MNLTREAILGHVAKPIGHVDVPELGGRVYIAGTSVEAADEIRKLVNPEEGGSDAARGMPTNVLMTVLFACDEAGEMLFTMDDAPALRSKPAKALTAISNKALDLNGLSQAGEEDAKNVSGAAESDDSASD